MRFQCKPKSFLGKISLYSMVAISLAACQSESSDQQGSLSPSADGGTRILSGTASMGLVSGAIVNAYAVEDGQLSTNVLGTTTTDGQGNYSMPIPQGYQGGIAVEVSANKDRLAPSLLMCHSASGCGIHTEQAMDTNQNGKVDFGETQIFPVDLKMRSLVFTDEMDNVVVNVSPFTHMSSVYAENHSQGIDAVSIGIGNSQISHLLEITGDITQLIPTDLTKETSIKEASAEELEYALLTSSFSGISANNQYELANVLQSYSDSYSNNVGQLYLNGESNLGYSDMLREAAKTAEHLSNVQSQHESQFKTYRDIYATKADAALLAEAGELTEAKPSPTLGKKRLEVVKAFVSDVRTWGNLIGVEEKNATNSFKSQVKIAGELLSVEVDQMAKAVAKLGKATLEVKDSGITNASLDTLVEGASGYLIYDPENYSAFAEGNIDGVKFEIELSLTNGASVTEWKFNASGLLQNDAAIMKLDNANFEVVYDLVDGGSDGLEFEIKNGAIRLDASVSQKATADVVDPVRFDGQLLLDFVKIDAAIDGIYYAPSNIRMKGVFKNSSGSRFSARFNVNVIDAESWNPELPESESHWINIGFHLGIQLSLQDIPKAKISIIGDRKGLSDGVASIKIRYGARSIALSYKNYGNAKNKLRIVNQDGVKMKIKLESSLQTDGSIVGEIIFRGKAWAEIRYVNGAYIIAYSDGTIESLI